MKRILSLTRKELEGYFGSPLALLFLGGFLAVELFIFFSVETFFARGIADVRPLFRWMPVLLIFLIAALTMRQWSEEKSSGTLEVLLTLPVGIVQLVTGKFLAVMTIILLALLLTLPLPISVSLIGNLDWGPVMGGYLAALLMAAAYAAIGLFVSSRSDNQIVALISTVALGGLFYLLGTRAVTDFLTGSLSEIVRALGTGSRFESIERGVIDLRDLVYYLSLTGFFLMLNAISLDSLRWSPQQVSYRRKMLTTAVLVGLNLILLNVWLFPVQGARLDLTEQRTFTLSQVSKDLVGNLQEPLLIRAFISEKNHPLLEPLVPQIEDMLREYEIASNGKLEAEVLDPLQDPELEAEANQTYGIRPSPFQIAGRYETSVINAYFDILVRYGDQTVTLGYSDLIEIESRQDGLDVRLRNLEYDLTRAIKKVVFGFQSVDAVLAALEQPVRLTLFETSTTLPEWMQATANLIQTTALDIAASSNGKFIFEVIDLDAPDSPVDRQFLLDTYGLQPIPTAFFSAENFYLHMVLQSGENVQLIYPPGELTEAEVRDLLEATLKRSSTGFLKTVGLWTPPETPTQDPFGQLQQPISTYRAIFEQLRQEYDVQRVDLSSGTVPANLDVLVVVAPQAFTDKDLFAIDQYLMRGGSVVFATSPYQLAPDQFAGGLSLIPLETGLDDWLKSYGIEVSDTLVMDRQNAPFPVTVQRNVGNFQVQEIQAIDYPFFVDVHSGGMNPESPMVANVPAVTLNWASPVRYSPSENSSLEATVILNSSAQAWERESILIQPNFEQYPDLGFAIEGEQGEIPLAISVQGSFESYFKDRANPFETADVSLEGTAEERSPETPEVQTTVIEKSPEAASLVVIGSAAFIDDLVLDLSARLAQDRYLNNLLLLQNAVDWSVEDLDLLTIRGRGTHTRVLAPLSEAEQTRWEISNYAIALLALIGIYFLWQVRRRSEQPIPLTPLSIEKQDQTLSTGELT